MPHDPIAAALALAKPRPHTGPIHSAVGGRTDHHPIDVPAESFVVPADVVSGLGQGNSANGLAILERMFPPENSGNGVPIMAAGGEYVVGPKGVAKAGNGDMKRGHQVLREFVKHARAEIIKTMKRLPGPYR